LDLGSEIREGHSSGNEARLGDMSCDWAGLRFVELGWGEVMEAIFGLKWTARLPGWGV